MILSSLNKSKRKYFYIQTYNTYSNKMFFPDFAMSLAIRQRDINLLIFFLFSCLQPDLFIKLMRFLRNNEKNFP